MWQEEGLIIISFEWFVGYFAVCVLWKYAEIHFFFFSVVCCFYDMFSFGYIYAE